jgi:hypothetical protein
MLSRANGIRLARRSSGRAKGRGTERRRAKKPAAVKVGKPDKMTPRGATRLHSRALASLRGALQSAIESARSRQGAILKALPHKSEQCFVRNQTLFLLRVTDDRRCGTEPPLGWTGGTTRFRLTPFLLCTATTRGKDDPYRGAFPRTGGEICFSRSEFWTETNRILLRRPTGITRISMPWAFTDRQMPIITATLIRRTHRSAANGPRRSMEM